MLFRQLQEPLSNTFTYLLGDERTGQAVLIDPVITSVERDLAEVRRLGLKLVCTVETHIHADHITGALELRRAVGSRIAVPACERLEAADIAIEEGKPLQFGGITLQPLHTPGHTAGHFSYLLGDRVFTGDALLIDGCGRTDFQEGDAATLYRSVHDKLFTLPDEVLVYPAHDYKDHFVSSIAQEKKRNPRLGGGRTLEEFRELMANLGLPPPELIDYAVAGNRQCGVCPAGLPQQLERYCRRIGDAQQA